MMEELDFEQLSKLKTEWKTISINDKDYLWKFVYEDGLWKVLITDFVKLLLEELSLEMIIGRCLQLNPALDIDVFDTKKYITYLFHNIDKYMTEVTLTHINLSKMIHGGIFKFCIDLKEGSCAQMWDHVTSQLCQSIAVLVQKNKMLVDIIKRKDEEILEYKLEGAKCVRDNIETEVFNEEKFNTMQIESDIGTPYITCIQSIINLNKCIKGEHSLTEVLKTESENIHHKQNHDAAMAGTNLNTKVENELENPQMQSSESDELGEQPSVGRRYKLIDSKRNNKRKYAANDAMSPKQTKQT